MNPQQRRFVHEYLVDFNATQAAGRAGYSLRDRAIGATLMAHPVILEHINQRCLAVQIRLEMAGDEVRRGFARIATDPREPALGGPSFEARIKALRELGKLLGLYTAKIQVSGSLTLVDLLLAADKTVHVEQSAVTH